MPRTTDRYKRTVARIKCACVEANAEQVSRGTAWVYRKYAKANNLYVLQHHAKAEKNYFRHMFREGRVIIPAAGWYEWSVENGKKQPWYIARKVNEPISHDIYDGVDEFPTIYPSDG